MNWDLIVAANSHAVLKSCLLSSPAVQQASQVVVQWGFKSAGQAYNDGLNKTRSEIAVFPHQDVYLPAGWDNWLMSSLERLSEIDKSWAVAGVFGMASESQFVGQVHCTRNGRIVGTAIREPMQAAALDELLLVVRRASGLCFDESLPGFHLYGTDICLEARRRGLRSYVVPAFCIHNASGWIFLPWAFWRSYFYLRKKWWEHLPATSPCAVIQRWPAPLFTTTVLSFYYYCVRRRRLGQRVAEPAKLAESILLSRQIGLNACGISTGVASAAADSHDHRE